MNRLGARRNHREARPPSTPSAGRMVGHSPAMMALRRRLDLFAATDAPVLIRGETGSGKEIAAAAVHRASARAGRPFVAVNCGAFPRELIEAELFGSLPGAYTGARQRDGLFVEADRGTLFLDEIGDLPAPAQVVLLRVLESGELRPVGGDRIHQVDVRVICATHRDLPAMVAERTFRADLYHRLAILSLDVPPLRARMDDLRSLARALVGEDARRLADDAWRRLEAHPWPGNVRELRNVLVRALAEHPVGAVRGHQLTFDETGSSIAAHPDESAVLRPLDVHLADYVKTAVTRCHGNVRATARALQVSPTTIYRYLAMQGSP